jgi:hypothetical protein
LRWQWYRIVDDAPAAPDDTLGGTCRTGEKSMDKIGAA